MRYISHLDLMRLFMRAFRRANFPLKMTQGFSPHPKFSIARALRLGIESDAEEAAVILISHIKAEEFQELLQRQLPQGINIRSVRIVPLHR